MRVFSSGLRNAVGIGFNPESDLWAAVNERDDLGDDVPSDFFTRVPDGGFYGFPYSYIGSHVDDRVAPRPDLVAKAIIPDLLLGAHVAPLQFAFYEGQQFPASYSHGVFIAEHGSWKRRIRSGCQVVFIPFRNGLPVGDPTPFFSGFVPDPAGKNVYGRLVGVAVVPDGSVLISDDGGKLIWRVSYQPEPQANSIIPQYADDSSRYITMVGEAMHILHVVGARPNFMESRARHACSRGTVTQVRVLCKLCRSILLS
jgi:glucose/arabinose dehydrogenase